MKRYIEPGCFNRKYDPWLSSLHALIGMKRSQAKLRKIPWSLTFAQAALFIGGNCQYCGIEPQLIYNSYVGRNGKLQQRKNMPAAILTQATITYSGIDRIDSDKGYTLNNCASCCKNCNIAKNTLSSKEFLNLIERIYKYNFK
jgi:hypothetical protein